VQKKKKKKKKKRLPKNYDPNVPPDPERWLPKRERSTYRRTPLARFLHLI
jgi:signal recognition particle subunit SRP72